MLKIKQFLPDKPQTFLYLVVGLLLIILLDIKDYVNYYKSQIVGVSDGSQLFSTNSIVPSFLSQSRMGEAVFWGILGASIYLLIWIANTIFTNFRNDFKADKFVHPANFNRSNFWKTIIVYKVSLLAVIIVTLIYIFNGLNAAHLAGQQFYKAVFVSSGIVHSLWVVALVLGLTVICLHIFIILMRVLFDLIKAVYRGL
jgi:hypothetical protein